MANKPVKKKAPVKKTVAKKTVAKKAPVKKAVAKKAAPVKKAVAKKAAPVKKAVAKKAATKKAATKKAATKKAPIKKAVATKAVSIAPTNEWLTKEPALPVFLQNQNTETRKLPIATREYGKNKKQSPKFVFVALVALLTISGACAYFLSNDNGTDVKATDISVNVGAISGESGSKNSQDKMTPAPTPTLTSTSETSTKPNETGNSSAIEPSSPKPTNKTEIETPTQSPRTFSSVQIDQGAMLKWLAPKYMERIVAFELYAKEDGQSSWTLISTVTTEQLEFEIELTPSESNSQFRVASLLSTNKKVFNPTTITLPGSLT